MSKLSLILFFLIKNALTIIYPLNLLLNSRNDISYSHAYDIFRSMITYVIGGDDSFMNNLNLSVQCKERLENSFFQYGMSISVSSFPYYQKMIFQSSRIKNDLSSFSECINNGIEGYIGVEDTQNFTYLTILIDDKKSIYDILTTNKGISSFLIGICFIDNCEIADYEKLIKKALIYLNVTKESNINNDINNSSDKEFEMKIYKIDNNLKSEGFIQFLQWLPFTIILIHFIFVIFNSIPIYFYKLIVYVFCCKNNNIILSSSKNSKLKNNLIKKKSNKKKNSNIKDSNDERTSTLLNFNSSNDNIIKSLELLYNISNNFSSLIELKKQNEITNDGGLSYINGIKGISMIFLLFGSVYSILYNSLVTEQNTEDFYSQLNNLFFSIFYIGIKYAPKLLLCSSGFSLFFKFLCYLDEKIDKEKILFRQKNDSFISGKEIKDIKNNSSSGISSNSFQRLKKKGKETYNISNLLSIKYIIQFFCLQFHKYILYILFICLVIFSLNWIVSAFGAYGPMWVFFYQNLIISSQNLKYLIPLLIGYKSYLIPSLFPEKHNILHYFYLVFQEIIYFLVSSIIIFIGYKKNIKIDFFFKILFSFLIIFRIIYYFIYIGLDDKDYFGFNQFGEFYNSMIYNYSFYILGIHYGMINYVIQKGYSVKDCNKQNKKFLISSINLLNPIKKKNKSRLFISIICSIFLIINIFIQQIIIYIIRIWKSSDLQRNMEIYKKDFFSQLIMLFDSDIFVLSINTFALCMYLKGDNLFNNILCHSVWSVFNRFYFSYILLINPIILYLLYNIESKIIFNMSNCFLYSFVCGIFVYFITMVVYIIFELPFKKIIRFGFKLREEDSNKERANNIEATYSYCKNGDFLDSATPSITDYNEEEEDEDEY